MFLLKDNFLYKFIAKLKLIDKLASKRPMKIRK